MSLSLQDTHSVAPQPWLQQTRVQHVQALWMEYCRKQQKSTWTIQSPNFRKMFCLVAKSGAGTSEPPPGIFDSDYFFLSQVALETESKSPCRKRPNPTFIKNDCTANVYFNDYFFWPSFHSFLKMRNLENEWGKVDFSSQQMRGEKSTFPHSFLFTCSTCTKKWSHRTKWGVEKKTLCVANRILCLPWFSIWRAISSFPRGKRKKCYDVQRWEALRANRRQWVRSTRLRLSLEINDTLLLHRI